MITIRSGKFKNKRLAIPPACVRPTSDKIRQAVFNVLMHTDLIDGFSLVGANVLDAFAGTGAMGLEALSRGAAHGWFMEKDSAIKKVLEQNISFCFPLPLIPSRRGRGNAVVQAKHTAPSPLAGEGTALPDEFVRQKAGGEGEASIILCDAQSPPIAPMPMQIIFLDPPYEQHLLGAAIPALAAQGWISDKTLLVIETKKGEAWQQPGGLKILDIRNYGNTDISFATFSRK